MDVRSFDEFLYENRFFAQQGPYRPCNAFDTEVPLWQTSSVRHMRRTELVEIIFALKQSEDQLKAENADLTAKLEQRQIHLDSAGSIAQAALELNHVFEAAQAAADDYLASVRSVDRDALQAQAKAEADQILAQARAEAEQLKAQTKRECDALTEAAEHKRAQTEADCAALRAKTEQEIAARRAAFEQSTRELLRSRCDTDILPEEGKVK